MTTPFRTGIVSFGTPMPKTGISKFKAKKGSQTIKILSVKDGDTFAFRVHYLPGIGSFHCFDATGHHDCDCCRDANASPDGNTTERFILPIAIYTPTFTSGIAVDFAYLPLPETKYTQLVNMHSNVGDITSYDIQIDCEDEGFQKYTFSPLVNKQAMINSIPNIEEKIQSFLADFRTNIESTVASKKFNQATYMQAKATALQKSANGIGAQFTPNTNTSAMFSQSQQVALPTQQVATPQLITTQPTPQPVAQPVIPQVNVQQVPQINPVPAVPVSQPETVVEQPVIEATVVQPATPVETTSITDGADGIDWDSMLKN